MKHLCHSRGTQKLWFVLFEMPASWHISGTIFLSTSFLYGTMEPQNQLVSWQLGEDRTHLFIVEARRTDGKLYPPKTLTNWVKIEHIFFLGFWMDLA